MIITASDIRTVRPVAANLSDSDRIDTYIAEAENLWVRPALGPAVYKAIEADRTAYSALLSGGYYDSDEKYCNGLTAAVAYLAYSRFIKNQGVNITAFGVVLKKSDYSEPVDEKTIARAANDAEKIGTQYLRECVEYLKYTEQLECSVKSPKTSRRFIKIG